MDKPSSKVGQIIHDGAHYAEMARRSMPTFLGVKRANTADTYDFLRRLEQEALTNGFEPAYAALEFKPSQFLQELKSAADAAVRLRDAVYGKEERNEWRHKYYFRFGRSESIHS